LFLARLFGKPDHALWPKLQGKLNREYLNIQRFGGFGNLRLFSCPQRLRVECLPDQQPPVAGNLGLTSFDKISLAAHAAMIGDYRSMRRRIALCLLALLATAKPPAAAERQPSKQKQNEQQSVQQQPSEQKPNERQSVQQQGTQRQPTERRPVRQQGIERQAAQQQAADERVAIELLIVAHAKTHGLPAALVRLVVRRESNFNPRAVYRGNYGLMQIRLGTARALGYHGTAEGLLYPATNMTYGVTYLAGAYRAARETRRAR
jgi:hypothetical protein